MRIVAVLIIFISSHQLALAQDTLVSARKGARQVTTRSVTGTYKTGTNMLRVLQLPGSKLIVELNAAYYGMNAKRYGPNLGTFKETVVLRGDTAVVKPKGGEESCEITMKFMQNKVIVSQKGNDVECGFGANVTADGVYVRRSRRRPKFDDENGG